MDTTISLATTDRRRLLAFYSDGRGSVAPSGTNECVLSVHARDEDGVRARYAAALAAGGTSVYEPAQQGWNAFAAQIEDPDGHLWMILVQPPDWAE